MKNFLERATDFRQSSNNYKFYVSTDQESEDLNKSLEEINLEKSKPKLLDGEIIITVGSRVLFFPNVADRTKGLSGNLYITNFRFLFDACEEDNSNGEESIHQINLLLGEHGTCLTNIESLYQLSGDKKKKLFPDSQLTEKVKGLQIVCKNLKVYTFNFDQSPIDEGKKIAKTLLHHAFPGRHQLLFAYDCSNTKLQKGKHTEGVVLFSEKNEWEKELLRTCSKSASQKSWRISSQNQKFQMSTSLPKWVIVPHSVLDYDYVTASQSFRCNRPPIWTWSSPNGAALIRMADLLPTIKDRTQENRMLENVRKCHPHLRGPCIKYLDKDLPSVSELCQSYSKLRELCIPDSHIQFTIQDKSLYSALENSKWLHYVSACLRVVLEAAEEIQRETTVVLQESDGRDTSAIVSSLVQLILDPHTRTIVGFQSLIQKEWVAMGHPFCKRLGLMKTNNNSEQSPVFLLFLDCVWQLQNQFPSSFEFTETYLTTLWDSVHVSVFDTFLFDCEKDRMDAFLNQTERLEPRSVWDWNLQFSENDILLFINPLYKFSQIRDILFCGSEGRRKEDTILKPKTGLPYMELWMQCYCRWLPLLSIKCGGRPQVDIIHRQLMKDIQSLLGDIQGYSKKSNSVYNTVISNNHSNINNNNNDGNTKKNTSFYSINLNSSSSGSNFNQNTKDINKSELSDSTISVKNNSQLLKSREVIDNFFPFTINGASSISSMLANSSNLSDLDNQSVLNSTD